jgi:hypothetical protein
MKKILFAIIILIGLNVQAQTKEEKWSIYISAFQNALHSKDKAKLAALVAPTMSVGISNKEWASEILSDRSTIIKIEKALMSKTIKGPDHDKMKCYDAMCLYFDFRENKWLLVDLFED